MRPAAKTALFSLATVLVAAVASELTLRVASALFTPPAQTVIPIALEDARLGKRPNPAYPGHDRNGFRNAEVPTHVALVAMGDSQTYGVGVSAADAWPQVFTALSGISTYSIGFGGFGPVHRLLLLDDAIALHPQLIIEAFYDGNDLYDSYALVYDQHQLPELRSADANVQNAIAEAERTDPIAAKTNRLFRACMPAAPPPRVSAFFEQHVRVYGLLSQLWELVQARSNAAPQSPEAYWASVTRSALAAPDLCPILETDTVHTVLTPPYRLSALDVTDPRIAEGERISFAAIKALHQRVTAAHIKFLVLLLPTKELVFKEVVEQSGHLPAEFRKLVDNEEQLTRSLRDLFASEGIDFVEALPGLRAVVSAGAQPYPLSWDGHPNPLGHRAIAQAVLDTVASRHLISAAGTAPPGG